MRARRRRGNQPPPEVILYIARRDGFTCHICGLGHLPHEEWEIEHNIAVANGGRDKVRNMRLAHGSCNKEKGTA